MTAFIPSVHDVEAMGVVLDDIVELSESFSPGDATALRVALVRQKAAIQKAIDFLDMHLVKTMELPVTTGGWIHQVRSKKDKERFDHAAIAGKVVAELKAQAQDAVDAGADDAFADGYVQGAREAVQIMTDLYISPSTTAKTTVLDQLGIERRKDQPGSVRTWTPGEKFVEVVPLLSEVQE